MSYNYIPLRQIIANIVHGAIDGVLICVCIGYYTYIDENG